MSRLSEYIKLNKDKVYKVAECNTPKNATKKVVIPNNDEWIEETEWDTLFKELQGAK